MSDVAFVRILGVLAVVVGLTGHLWMLNAAGGGGHGEMVVASSVSASPTPATPSGCPMDMSTCQVPMPAGPAVALLVLVLLIAVRLVGPGRSDEQTHRPRARSSLERAPPSSPSTSSSVVLLV